MSFFKKLFGIGGGATGAPANQSPTEDYKGFTIRATPFEEGGAYQLCGVISKEIDGEVKEHRFVRADRLPSLDVAQSMALSKARQIIDFDGERLFGKS